jgi:hypothetical protein
VIGICEYIEEAKSHPWRKEEEGGGRGGGGEEEEEEEEEERDEEVGGGGEEEGMFIAELKISQYFFPLLNKRNFVHVLPYSFERPF